MLSIISSDVRIIQFVFRINSMKTILDWDFLQLFWIFASGILIFLELDIILKIVQYFQSLRILTQIGFLSSIDIPYLIIGI